MPPINYPVPGGTVAGYLAVPSATPGPWSAVVVIHEAFGLNDDMRGKADELADHGYLALAPDQFEGKSWIRCIRSAFRQLAAGSGPAFTALDAARTFLSGRTDCTGKAGVIGFCMGGGFALLCAPRKGFDVAAVNYGPVPKDAESVLAGSCPIVGSFGGRDRMGAPGLERLQRASCPRGAARREGVSGLGTPVHDRVDGSQRGAGETGRDELPAGRRRGRLAAHLRVL
jgi:carboxymethylenebutenolidase